MKILPAFKDIPPYSLYSVDPDLKKFKSQIYNRAVDCIDIFAVNWLYERGGGGGGGEIPITHDYGTWRNAKLSSHEGDHEGGFLLSGQFYSFMEGVIKTAIIGAKAGKFDTVHEGTYYQTKQFFTWMADNDYAIPNDLIGVSEKPSAKKRDEQCIALAKRIHEDHPILCKGNIARIIRHTDLGKMYPEGGWEAAIKKAMKGALPNIKSGNPTKKIKVEQKELEDKIIRSSKYS